MADVNRVILIGRLTRDPQVKFLPNQTAICEFGLAMGRKFKTAQGEQKEETTFVDCVVFGKPGETFAQYMKKGKPVYIEGRLKLDQWDDKQTGQKRSKLSVAVDQFQFIGGRDDEGQQKPSRPGGYGSGMAGGSKLPAMSEPPPIDDERHISEDDIPF